MASKTTGQDEDESADEIVDEHEFYNMGDDFMRELEAHQKSSDKVSLTYWASIDDGTTETTFERTKLVSSATVRRAQQDKAFEYKFAYGIAIPYLPEMLASAKHVCKNCGKPATRILQTPTTHCYQDPPMVQDIQATPMCDSTFCNNKAKSDYMEMVGELSKLQELLKTKGVDMNVSPRRAVTRSNTLGNYIGRFGVFPWTECPPYFGLFYRSNLVQSQYDKDVF